MIIVMGDLNAKVGSSNAHREEVMGKFGVGIMNDNGERLCDFCSVNGLVITGTIFPHKEIHKLTWRSPDGKTVNQIDHVVVNGRMRTSIMDTRVMRGADVYSDYYLLRTRVRLKLARVERGKMARVRFDIHKLRSEEIRKRYNIEVKNRFEAPGDIEDQEEEHDKLLEAYRDAAEKVIGRSKKQSKPWIGDKTWKKVKERKDIKLRMEGARSERLKQRWRKEYKVKDKEVKGSAREDKRNWLEEKAAAAEKAAENGRNRELYNMTKAIVEERKRQEVGVRNKQGELKTEAREKLQRWVEHFSETLNRDDPTNPVEEYSREEEDEIEEIEAGKAVGVDEVGPDLLRPDMEGTAGRLTRCYNRLWEAERWLKVRKKGRIVKILKKGDCAIVTTGEG